MAGSTTGDMDEFTAEVRAFLDASAPRRPDPAEAVAWGEGADQIAYFSTDPPDVDRADDPRPRPAARQAAVPARDVLGRRHRLPAVLRARRRLRPGQPVHEGRKG